MFDEESAPADTKIVARHWRLQQVLINGHSSFRLQAEEAKADLQSIIANDAQRQELAEKLLNLFVFWHNMRVFERGKRQEKSPYQLAGIDPGADDWLTLLGYPAG